MSEHGSGPPPHASAAELEQRLRADPGELIDLGRRITGYLAGWRAYDFRDEWPDLVSEVLEALLVALRHGRLRDASALPTYLRTTTRNKFTDRLRRRAREGSGREAWAAALPQAGAADGSRPELVAEVRLALEKLPERQRAVLFGVYGQGKTYQMVADETGIPLGSLKRDLRGGLAALRRDFETDGGVGSAAAAPRRAGTPVSFSAGPTPGRRVGC